MAAGPSVTARLDELVALFNRRSLDLPDGLFDRRTQFLLNGTPFEAMLGRSPGDPLVLMIARGPAGYRFAAKALQHAVPDGRVERGELTPQFTEFRIHQPADSSETGTKSGRSSRWTAYHKPSVGLGPLGPDRFTVPLWLSGRLRGSDRPVEAVLQATVVMAGNAVSTADLAVDEAVVEALREARLRD